MRASSVARKTARSALLASNKRSAGGVPADGCRWTPPLPLVLRVLTSDRFRTKQTASLLGLLLPPAPTHSRICGGSGEQQQQQQQQADSCTCPSACFSAPTSHAALNEIHAVCYTLPLDY